VSSTSSIAVKEGEGGEGEDCYVDEGIGPELKERKRASTAYLPFCRKMSQLIIGQIYPLALIPIRLSLLGPNGRTRGVQFSIYQMPQKHHQEEISGPLDTIEAASLARDLPRPKRARIQSRKARENRAQSQPFEVLSLRPTAAPKKRAHREASEASSVNGALDITPNQR
jgi:hypothetical protein